MATYYVRKTGNNGNAGTTGSPWLTIAFGMGQLANGDTLIVGDGTYNESGLAASGSSSGYKTVQAENKWGAIITAPGSGNCFSGTANYLVIDGFKITASLAHGIEFNDSHHVVIRNVWADGCLNSGISLIYGEFYLIEDCLCTGNAWGGWFSGISMFQCRAIAADTTPIPGAPSGFRIAIRRCECHDNQTYSWLQFDGGSVEIEVGDVVTGATSGASGTVGYIDVTGGTWGGGNAVGEVAMYDVTETGFQDNEQLRVGGVTHAIANGTLTGVHTDGNGIIYDDWQNLQGGTVNYPHAGLIEDVLSYRNGGKGVQVAWSDNVTVRNVTAAWNSRDGSNDATWDRGEISNQDSNNSIFVNCIAITNHHAWTTHGSSRNVAVHFGQAATGCKVRNCLSWTGTPGQNAVTTNDGGTYTAEGTNLFGTDPELVDIDAYDFHPLSGSPVIDAGSDVYGFADTDIEGTSRTSTTINIGALEQVDGGGSVGTVSVTTTVAAGGESTAASAGSVSMALTVAAVSESAGQAPATFGPFIASWG